MSRQPLIELSAARIHLDGDVGIRLIGVEPGSEATLAAELVDDRDTSWRSDARFTADWIGTVDVARDAPVSGGYAGVDPNGLLWSMAPVPVLVAEHGDRSRIACRCGGTPVEERGGPLMPLLLKNGRVLTMADGEAAREADVLIEGSRIARVEPDIVLDGATVVDCRGKTLIPGLWDMHAHIISSEMFGLFLANGVTGVRNMWGNRRILEWAAEVASGARIGPSIHTTSPLMDGVEAWAGAVVVTTPEEAERAVLDAVGDGYPWLKTYPSIPREAFVRLMELAHEHGVEVVGHGNANVTTDELVELGYHSIEHATILPKSDDEVLRMAESGMWFVPTLIVVHRLWELALRGDDVTQVPHYQYVNAREREDWDGITKALKTMPRNFLPRAWSRRSLRMATK